MWINGTRYKLKGQSLSINGTQYIYSKAHRDLKNLTFLTVLFQRTSSNLPTHCKLSIHTYIHAILSSVAMVPTLLRIVNRPFNTSPDIVQILWSNGRASWYSGCPALRVFDDRVDTQSDRITSGRWSDTETRATETGDSWRETQSTTTLRQVWLDSLNDLILH